MLPSHSDITNFVEGNINFYQRDVISNYIREQIAFRMASCPECVRAGKCLVCKCPSPKLFFSPLKEDSKGRWGPFLLQEEWEKFKEKNTIPELPEDLQNRYTELWTKPNS